MNTNARRLRRFAYVAATTAVCCSTIMFAVPSAIASASGLSAGNLLVSTSVYDDVPNITAGTTTLPLQNSVFVTGVKASGTAPNIVATITSLSASGFAANQSVTISGVAGATQVNGTWPIASVPTTKTFTINMGSVSPSAYTSGGVASVPVNPTAVASGQYPYVFNNANVDANFGITEPIVLDQIPPTTSLVTTPITQTTVPNSDSTTGDQMVTSFSSKSELGLNQSTDGSYVSFMGYNAPTAAIDVSNSNTPIEQDPTNSDTAGPSSLAGYYRDVATMDGNGTFQFTDMGAYGGNNGRGAILDPATNTLFTGGNAGNGANPPYQGVVIGSGSQIATRASTSQAAQEAAGVPAPTAYGNFNITQISGNAADKSTKDDNFRGISQYNNVIYMSKGSGSNGINTVYFVDTTGTACPSGSGVPESGASLPSLSSWTSSSLHPTYNTTNTALGMSATNPGLSPTNMCILNGFPTGLASSTTGTVYYPFGMWFANPTTLYVADEGNGKGGSTDTTGGLQKWVLNTATNTWSLQYTLTAGLNLQTSYTSINTSPPGVNGIAAGGQSYPTGTNSSQGGTGGNWTPANDGLRNIVGRINGDGTVTIWATTSTISGGGDTGADPNEVVAVTDNLANTTAGPSESFNVVMAPTAGVVYRGVSFTPNTSVPDVLPEVPWVPLIPLSVAALGGGYLWWRRRNRNRKALPAV
jgi:hypothetical protein